MKTLVYKSLVVLVVILSLSFASCSKDSSIVDPTQSVEQTQKDSKNDTSQNGGIDTDSSNDQTGNDGN
jgi:hypothetical protein